MQFGGSKSAFPPCHGRVRGLLKVTGAVQSNIGGRITNSKMLSGTGWTSGTESETCTATSLSHTKRSEAYAKAAPTSHHATQDSLSGLDLALSPALRPIWSRVGCRIQFKHVDQEPRG